MKTLEELKAEGEAPEWLTGDAFQTLRGGYLWNDETPKAMYRRVAASVAKSLKKPELEDKFFGIMWKNWLCLLLRYYAMLEQPEGFLFLVSLHIWQMTRMRSLKPYRK